MQHIIVMTREHLNRVAFHFYRQVLTVIKVNSFLPRILLLHLLH
ncbi:hypothetical protein [Hymenobacter qilianensis]|nr:hypothetical protein [Hymenobacter qilianensis]